MADASNNAYQAAIANVSQIIQYMLGTVNQFAGDAQSAINALGQWRPPDEVTPPNISVPYVTADTPPEFPNPEVSLFGELPDLELPDMEDFTGLIEEFDIADGGEFNPRTSLPNMPSAPTPIDTSGRPSAPSIDTSITIPDAPDATPPAMDALDQIVIPSAPSITLPQFNVDELPTFDTQPPSINLNWHEQPYAAMVANEVSIVIKAMLSGQFSMPPAVRDALFSAARDREAMTARQSVETAFDEWAGRGFPMPPGMLVEQVNTAQEQSRLQQNAISRDTTAKEGEWANENLRNAIAQGIALESAWMQLWNNVQQRALDAAKTMVEIAKDQFNLLATAFNLNLQRVQLKKEVFEAQLRAELAKLDVYKGELEAAQLAGTLNEQRVRIYTARVQALQMLVAVYTGKLDGVKAREAINRDRLDQSRIQTEIWATGIKAQESNFTAYEAVGRVEASKATAYQAEAGAYAETLRAAANKNETRLGVVNAKIRALEGGVSKFTSEVQAKVSRISALRDAIGARAQAYTAQSGYLGEKMRAFTARSELGVRAQEATTRNNIAYFETISRQFDARASRVLQAASMLKDALQAAGQIASQAVAGATSAIHTQSSVSGSGSESSSFSREYQYKIDGGSTNVF